LEQLVTGMDVLQGLGQARTTKGKARAAIATAAAGQSPRLMPGVADVFFKTIVVPAFVCDLVRRN
jgi:hypothetical protein